MTKKTLHYSTAICIASIALMTAGCGSSDSAAPKLPTASSSPAASANTDAATGGTGAGATGEQKNSKPVSSDPEEAKAQYDRCLTDQGLGGADSGFIGDTDLAANDGTSFSAGVNDARSPSDESADMTQEAIEAGLEACKPYLDAAIGDETVDPEVEAELADANLAAAQCLRDAGYDVELDAKGTMSQELAPDQDPAEFDAALQQCNG